MTKTSQQNNLSTPSFWQKKEGETFDIFESYQKIGRCSYTVVQDQKYEERTDKFFPDSWFHYKKSGDMRPILEIIDFKTIKKNQGYGRLCLMALSKLSQKKGCEGRLQVIATADSGAFYEHCGFKGLEKGKDGYKYFDPSLENLQLLFSKDDPSTNLKFIPVSKSGKEVSPALIKRVLGRTDY